MIKRVPPPLGGSILRDTDFRQSNVSVWRGKCSVTLATVCMVLGMRAEPGAAAPGKIALTLNLVERTGLANTVVSSSDLF